MHYRCGNKTECQAAPLRIRVVQQRIRVMQYRGQWPTLTKFLLRILRFMRNLFSESRTSCQRESTWGAWLAAARVANCVCVGERGQGTNVSLRNAAPPAHKLPEQLHAVVMELGVFYQQLQHPANHHTGSICCNYQCPAAAQPSILTCRSCSPAVCTCARYFSAVSWSMIMDSPILSIAS